MPTEIKIFVSAGEISGDQRAAEVIRDLRLHCGNISLSIRGLGGAELEKSGVDLIEDSRLVAGVMGFTELLGHRPSIFNAYRRLKHALISWRPDVVFLVDFPEFNMRLAKQAHRLGIPVYYYVPPKVWASREYRIHSLGTYCTEIGAIFPFEPPFYQKRGISNITYVGHPFVESIKERSFSDNNLDYHSLGLSKEERLLVLMAGSRAAELRRHVPILYELVNDESFKKLGLSPIWIMPSKSKATELTALLRTISLDYQPVIYTGPPYDIMRAAEFGILKSGTCNLEAAFCGLPLLCFYKASPLSAWIVKNMIKISEVSLVNIVRPGTIVEFLQDRCTAANLLDYLFTLFGDSHLLQKLKADLALVRNEFNTNNNQQAAEIVAKKLLSLASIPNQ
jgi:lipid-A-disaccharide synthase